MYPGRRKNEKRLSVLRSPRGADIRHFVLKPERSRSGKYISFDPRETHSPGIVILPRSTTTGYATSSSCTATITATVISSVTTVFVCHCVRVYKTLLTRQAKSDKGRAASSPRRISRDKPRDGLPPNYPRVHIGYITARASVPENKTEKIEPWQLQH